MVSDIAFWLHCHLCLYDVVERTQSAHGNKAAMNSYGAGYDAGYAAAISETIQEITGDEP